MSINFQLHKRQRIWGFTRVSLATVLGIAGFLGLFAYILTFNLLYTLLISSIVILAFVIFFKVKIQNDKDFFEVFIYFLWFKFKYSTELIVGKNANLNIDFLKKKTGKAYEIL